MMCVYKISSGIWQWKNFVNQCTFAKVMMKSQVYCFFDSQCRHPMEGYVGSKFLAICNHCAIMAALSRKTLKSLRNFCIFWKKRPLMVKFPKFRKISSQHQSACCVQNFVKFGRYNIGKIVRGLPDKKTNCALFTWQKTKFCPALQLSLLRIVPKIYQGQPPTMYSECSRFHPNWFFQCINTAIIRRKVNPIFVWSLASSRIIIIHCDIISNDDIIPQYFQYSKKISIIFIR